MSNTNLYFGEKLIELINLRNGGLAIYGGIIAGLLTVFFVCRYKKINLLKFLDATGPAVMIAQAIGRWGNFFNAEAYGSKTDLPWRMGLLPNMDSNVTMYYYHPTFLYESLWNVIGFVIITLLYKKKKFNGQNALMYLCWYGFGRMFIEGLRTDSLYVGPFRISQVIGMVCFVVAGGLLIAGLLMKQKGKLEKLLGGLLVAPPAPLPADGEDKTESDHVNGDIAETLTADEDASASEEAIFDAEAVQEETAQEENESEGEENGENY